MPNSPSCPPGPFDIVYADPPWHYYGSLRARLGDNRWIGPRLQHEAEPLRLNCELVGFLAPQDQHDLLRESAAVLGGALAPPEVYQVDVLPAHLRDVSRGG